MWRSRSNSDRTNVVCIACGDSLPRTEAREYDKHGDRWDRQGKQFEHLCKDCYREMTHQPRDGLEDLLEEVESPGQSTEAFVERYLGEVEARSKEPER